jgi:hypothetical protein
MNKIIVAIIIHNRFENLERWINCWKQCEKREAELVIIHNYDNDPEKAKFQSYCYENDIKYVPRVNIGFDIGAFQDICRERLAGFDNDWSVLLWVTDDVIPMTKDFLAPFLFKISEPDVGISCLEISKEVVPHVRTTGFCIRKEIASKLIFPADPIIDKWQCYQFEHRGGKEKLVTQIQAMGLRPVAVSKIQHSPLWDTGLKRSLLLNRWEEHKKAFTETKDKVTFICPVYNKYPFVISSLLAQTHTNWDLILIHDGPDIKGIKDQIPQDERITFHQTPERVGNWGHKIRSEWVTKMKDYETGYVVVTNADNYMVPSFIEFMLNGFIKNQNAVATYCEKMIHSYIGWEVIQCRMERGFVDCGGVMIKKEVAAEIGWNETNHHSADWFYFKGIIDKYGIKSFQPVKGALFIHN